MALFIIKLSVPTCFLLVSGIVAKGDESNKTLTVALALDMQFCSSRIRLLMAKLNIAIQWCAEYLWTLLYPIYLKWKSKQLVSELLDSTYRGSPKNGVYLEISLLHYLTKKKSQVFSRTFPKFHQNSRTFQDLPGMVGTMKGKSRNLESIFLIHQKKQTRNFKTQKKL